MKDVEKYPNEAGVYMLINSISGKIYIGKSVNIYQRMNHHKNSIKRSGNGHFQNAIKKYGWDNFTFQVLEIFENFDKRNDNISLLNKEAYYIKLYESTNPKIGYNICEYSSDTTGIPRKKISEETRMRMKIARAGLPGTPHTEETKRKIGFSRKGYRHTEETKKKMSDSRKGFQPSEETKRKMGDSRKGFQHTEETKKKMSLHRLGKPGIPHTEETKEKLRNLNLGKKHTEETKEKVRISSLGRIVSDETREKMRASNLGKKRSDETRRRISEAKKKK